MYSQLGEDGILERVFEVLPVLQGPRWCVEFGSGDGVENSNTRHLIEARGWHSVQIEADRERFAKLAALYVGSPDVTCFNRRVGWDDADCLDAVLAGTPVPLNFDLLSIDIDGNDWYAWAAVKRYRPRCVVVEFNPSFPSSAVWLQPADPAVNQGCSLAALADLGRHKGYELVAATQWNAVFVLAGHFGLFGLSDNRPAAVWQYPEYLTYVAQGYDGTLIPGGNASLLWRAGVQIDLAQWASQIQVLAEDQRKYGGTLKGERANT